jgi:hypothetical protein
MGVFALSVGVLIVEHMLLVGIEIVLHNAVGLLRTVFKGMRLVCNESPPPFKCEGGNKECLLRVLVWHVKCEETLLLCALRLDCSWLA